MTLVDMLNEKIRLENRINQIEMLLRKPYDKSKIEYEIKNIRLLEKELECNKNLYSINNEKIYLFLSSIK